MADPFLGEIKIFGGTFAPYGYAFCNGQIMSISQNDALFALIGTTYGGDGMTTFALPNLQGRVPIHQGQGSGLSNYTLGEVGGSESVTLNTNQIPSHSHPTAGDANPGTSTDPSNHYWAASTDLRPYTDQIPNASMLSLAGGNQSHANMLPFLAVNFIIALEGIFPSRN
jgi:microcystin-dependent protein